MNITMIGTGYVGLVTGTCFAEKGFNVTCVDLNEDKINKLHNNIMPIYEPGLDKLVEKNVADNRLSFTTDLKSAVSKSDLVFICVGTPENKETGHADMKYVYGAAKEIGEALQGFTVIVDKSTVPVGTGDAVEKIIKETNPNADFAVASNPEFLREGSAISDFLNPDRVVVGTDNEKAKSMLANLYKWASDEGFSVMFTARRTAELIKYAANAFLAMKITYINEIADLCENVEANVEDVALGIGLDSRIGKKFLQAGPGYGGSCFPKDTMALVRTSEQFNSPIKLIQKTTELNEARKLNMVGKIKKAFNGDVKGKDIAILGLTFKANTDDMRESCSTVIIPELAKLGANIKAYDPQGMEEAKHLIKADITYCDSKEEALKNADGLVILTEWDEFKNLSVKEVTDLMKGNLFIDLRNLYDDKIMKQDSKIKYVSLGR